MSYPKQLQDSHFVFPTVQHSIFITEWELSLQLTYMTRIQSLKNQWSENSSCPSTPLIPKTALHLYEMRSQTFTVALRSITVLLALKNLYERHFRTWKHRLDQKVNYLFFPNSIKILYGPDTAEFEGVFFPTICSLSTHILKCCQIWHFIEMLYFRNLVKCLHKTF